MPKHRTLILLRHSKSTWGLDVHDHERPLSSRGRRDGVAAGKWFARHGVTPDAVLCSSAVRTRETWDRLAKGGIEAGEVSYHDKLYEAFVPDLHKVLRKLPGKVRTAMLIGHSPGVPDLLDTLAARDGKKNLWASIDKKFPTSAFAIITFDGPWSDLKAGTAKLETYQVPRG